MSTADQNSTNSVYFDSYEDLEVSIQREPRLF